MHINEKGLITLDAGEPQTVTGKLGTVPALVFGSSPNCGPRLIQSDVKFIVAHWTGGSSADSAKNWLTSPDAKASAHFILDRNGQIIQIVATDKVAWHVGPSEWKTKTQDYVKLNRYSIGIEYVNLGKLTKTEGGTFKSTTGRVVPSEEVVSHNDKGVTSYYQSYPHDQLMAGLNLMAAIKKKFKNVENIVGHNDIATPPGRKQDPGPEFPMDWYRSKIVGRIDDDE